MLSLRSVQSNLLQVAVQNNYNVFHTSATGLLRKSHKAKRRVIRYEEPPKTQLPFSHSVKTLVPTAFDLLKGSNCFRNETASGSKQLKTRDEYLYEAILNATNVIDMLCVLDNRYIKKSHALKAVTILADWTTLNRANAIEFRNDRRFIKMLHLLNRSEAPTIPEIARGFRTPDLSLVMSVKIDEDIAKQIPGLSLGNIVNLMRSLVRQKYRSLPLLRSLADNISGSSDQLSLKQCADVLYTMIALNYCDSVLVTRIGIDIVSNLAKPSAKSANIESILTSLGLMKFKDSDLLDSLAAWTIEMCKKRPSNDLKLALFMTLATANYPTIHADKLESKLVDHFVRPNLPDSLGWLNFVWSLTVLQFAKPHHVESVLRSEFIAELIKEQGPVLQPSTKIKLLNINAAAKLLMPEYRGATISPKSTIFSVPLGSTKTKNVLITALTDAMCGLFTTKTNVRTHSNTQMGFILDAECIVSRNRELLPLDQNHEKAIRYAMIVLDFQDLCQGMHNQVNGRTALNIRLLEKSGYKVLTFPHFEFNGSDAFPRRVQYLEGKIGKAKSAYLF